MKPPLPWMLSSGVLSILADLHHVAGMFQKVFLVMSKPGGGSDHIWSALTVQEVIPVLSM